MDENGFYAYFGGEMHGPSEPSWLWRIDGIVPGWYTAYEPCQGWYSGTDENVARAKMGLDAASTPRGLGYYRVDTESGDVVHSVEVLPYGGSVRFQLLISEHEYYQSHGWDDPANGVTMWRWNYFETREAAYAHHNVPLPPPAWAPATAYKVGNIATTDRPYVCTQAGTSDEWGQGPQSWMGDMGIMDGTVIWDVVLA